MDNWDSDVYARLDILSISMKASSLYSMIEKEQFIKVELDKLWQFNVQIKQDLSWDKVKYFLSISANSDFYCTVIRSKWNEISLQSFNLQELNKMKKILRLLLMNINQENVKRRRVSLSSTRKHSADQLERMMDEIEESNLERKKVKFIMPKN